MAINVSDHHMVRYLIQNEQIVWRIDMQEGGFYAIVDNVLLKLVGNDSFMQLKIRGLHPPEIYLIAAGSRRFYSNEDLELKDLLKQLLDKIVKQIYPNPNEETVKVFEKQRQEIKNKLWAKITGWDDK